MIRFLGAGKRLLSQTAEDQSCDPHEQGLHVLSMSYIYASKRHACTTISFMYMQGRGLFLKH